LVSKTSLKKAIIALMIRGTRAKNDLKKFVRFFCEKIHLELGRSERMVFISNLFSLMTLLSLSSASFIRTTSGAGAEKTFFAVPTTNALAY
jgi:hypothetical protein